MVTPINPREEAIEGQKCSKSLSDLPDPKDVAVSIVTPPGKRRGNSGAYSRFFFVFASPGLCARQVRMDSLSNTIGPEGSEFVRHNA